MTMVAALGSMTPLQRAVESNDTNDADNDDNIDFDDDDDDDDGDDENAKNNDADDANSAEAAKRAKKQRVSDEIERTTRKFGVILCVVQMREAKKLAAKAAKARRFDTNIIDISCRILLFFFFITIIIGVFVG